MSSSPSTLLRRATDRHPFSLDIGRPVMAKANVQIQDIDWKQAVGRAIERAVAIAGWTKGEAAGKVDVDASEFGKWMTGERRPHLDRLLAIPELRQPLVVALAALDPDAFSVKHVIETRRLA